MTEEQKELYVAGPSIKPCDLSLLKDGLSSI